MFQTIFQTIFVFTLLCLKDNETANREQSVDPVCSHLGNVSCLNSLLFWMCFYIEEEIFYGFYDELLVLSFNFWCKGVVNEVLTTDF